MRAALFACAFALAALGGSTIAARADGPGGALGLTLNPIATGVHESYNDTIHLPPIPVPLLEGNVHAGPVELTGYGLPALLAVPYTDSIQGPTLLRLSIFDGTLRVWDGGHHLALGIGETIYNQTTHYAVADFFAATGGERQYSRIVGAHYEVAARIPFRSGTLQASLRYAPVLTGTQVSTYDNGYPSRFDPERGEQIDGDIQYVHHISRHYDALLGIRYVNFTAAYAVAGETALRSQRRIAAVVRVPLAPVTRWTQRSRRSCPPDRERWAELWRGYLTFLRDGIAGSDLHDDLGTHSRSARTDLRTGRT